jgi:uncharacterized protein (DUF1501 family)
MCTDHSNHRQGISLEHPEAHQKDHELYSRKAFLGLSGIMAGAGIMIGSTPIRATAVHPMLEYLMGLETDRVLVIIQLNGGNDGLNTVIPIENDTYYKFRPTLGIRGNDAFKLNNEVALHRGLRNFEPLWKEGKMGIIRNVGYPDPNMSHFRSTDIWVTGTDSNMYESTGWLGRFMDKTQEDNKPYPIAVQVGTNQSLIFQNGSAPMSMNLNNPDTFERLSREGKYYRTDNYPNNASGIEQSWVRTLANKSYIFAGAIHEASKKATNEVEYPQSNNWGLRLGVNLAITAQLIKGGLKSRIYLVELNGFDTHAMQANMHHDLMTMLSESVVAFYADLAKKGMASNVLTMTFSEFGRTLRENGSAGTDHATSAPMFLFGEEAKGGMIGKAPSLTDLDSRGEMKFEYDYRQVYSSVLQDWFGVSDKQSSDILKRDFGNLGLIRNPIITSLTETEEQPKEFNLHQNYPNPFNPSTTISYTLNRTERVRLRVFDTNGRLVRTLVDADQHAGTHEVRFDAFNLASGVYLYTLESPSFRKSMKMTLLK